MNGHGLWFWADFMYQLLLFGFGTMPTFAASKPGIDKSLIDEHLGTTRFITMAVILLTCRPV
jgi:hypothetical protein